MEDRVGPAPGVRLGQGRQQRGQPGVGLVRHPIGLARADGIVAGTVTTLAVFIPVIFLTGMIRFLFEPLSIAATTTIGASFFQQYFSEMMIAQVTACGGLLIVGIGINLLELTEIKLANLLPSLAYVVILTALFA